MAAFGKIEEFNPEADVWDQYTERLEHYFAANEIEDVNKQKAILLSVCGSKTYKLMSNLLAPEKPGDKSFKELKDLIQKHHHPKPSEIVQRLKFNSRVRNSGESVATFVSELRRLTADCNYGATLKDMLRDRLVCGINDDRIQRRLLSETDLDFDKALKIATAMEMAAKNAVDVQKQTQATQQVHKVTSKGGNHGTTTKKPASGFNSEKKVIHGQQCYRCGKHHSASVCRYRETKCWNCGKIGHLEKKCQQKPQGKGHTPNK